MKEILTLGTVVLCVCFNLILYFSTGFLILYKKGGKASVSECVMIGFFGYYVLFFILCVPVMKFYRPLSMLTGIWVIAVLLIFIMTLILILREGLKAGEKGFFKRIRAAFMEHPLISAGFILLVFIQIILVSGTYNFTLDAAYYVAGVSTNVDTNMINVYDPFTGAWQDHFEMRYFFATYSVQDAVICQLTGISPLIWTKSVMAVTIIILTNMVYYMIAKELVPCIIKSRDALKEGPSEESHVKKIPEQGAILLMMLLIFIINVTFNTIYTSSLFLMTRTYEGKAIVGNLAVMSLFYMFLKINGTGSEKGEVSEGVLKNPWFCLFLICAGASTISSTANMLMPVELTVLFIPYIIRTKNIRLLPKYILCVLPGVVFTLSFVLYVKGYFVFYTYPR